MSDGRGRARLPRGSRRLRWLPFAALQAIEIAVAVIFAYLSVHVSNSSLMVVAGAAFAVLAVTARGSLGIVRLFGQRLHIALVAVVGVAVGLAPIIPAFRPDIQGIIVLEFGIVGLIRLATFTQTDSSAPGIAGRRRSLPVVEATATVVEAPATRSPGPAGRPTSDPGAPSPAATGAAARWLGRTTGAAAASGRRAVAQHRPEAEAQAKRTIRSAGRIAGRITSSAPTRSESPPD
jgi:hypothetical protein